MPNKYQYRFQLQALLRATPHQVFEFADDHHNFASHMNQSSLLMAGSKMETTYDKEMGKKVGSHIIMEGKILGLNLFLDEVVTKRQPPWEKSWETVKAHLLVIGDYRLGFSLTAEKKNTHTQVYIEYNLPSGKLNWLLGRSLGHFYARWCVEQMISGLKRNFSS